MRFWIAAIALLVAPCCADARQTTITFERVPSEIVSVSIGRWGRDAPAVSSASVSPVAGGGSVAVRDIAGEMVVVFLLAADGRYLAQGPFSWPERDETRLSDAVWRRTVRGTGVGDTASPIEWIFADGRDGEFWPRCSWAKEKQWECWGVPENAAGLVMGALGQRIWWSVVHGNDGVDAGARSTTWGRLLIVRSAGGEPVWKLQVTAARPVPPPPQRMRDVRLGTASVEGLEAVMLGETAAWVAGERVPPGAWLEVRASQSSPVFLPIEDVSAGPRSTPLFVTLNEARLLQGKVRGAGGEPASGAVVTLFRLIDPVQSEERRNRPKPRRVFAAETTVGEEGSYSFGAVGDVPYELVAWHSQLGRRTALVQPGETTVMLDMEAPPLARGRVLKGGRPASGVDVVSVPDPLAVIEADDLVELKGGSARSGPDGRFVVSLPPAGGGELRIGGGADPIKRIPLPRGTPPAALELGSLDLGSAIEVTLMLDRRSACELRAVGPIGHAGLQIVQAARTGPGVFSVALPEPGMWNFVLMCGGNERRLSPATVLVSERTKTVQLMVR